MKEIVKLLISRRLWPLHWVLWLCAAVGVAALLVARGHYTVPCVQPPNPVLWNFFLYRGKSISSSGWCGYCLLCNDPSLVSAQLDHQPQTVPSEGPDQLPGKVLSYPSPCTHPLEPPLLRLWWWRLAVWFEENVRGPVPPGSIFGTHCSGNSSPYLSHQYICHQDCSINILLRIVEIRI